MISVVIFYRKLIAFPWAHLKQSQTTPENESSALYAEIRMTNMPKNIVLEEADSSGGSVTLYLGTPREAR